MCSEPPRAVLIRAQPHGHLHRVGGVLHRHCEAMCDARVRLVLGFHTVAECGGKERWGVVVEGVVLWHHIAHRPHCAGSLRRCHATRVCEHARIDREERIGRLEQIDSNTCSSDMQAEQEAESQSM